MRLYHHIAAFVVIVFMAIPAHAQNKIAAVVNDDVISDMDVAQRKKMLTVLAQKKQGSTPKISTDALLDQLIDEKLKQQENKRAGASISPKELEDTVRQAVRQNGFSETELKKIFAQNGLPYSLVEEQIKNDLLFLRSIRKNSGKRADISEAETDARFNDIKTKMTTKHYLLSEIVIPIKGKSDEDLAYGRAMQVLIALREGKAFPDLAREFSAGPSAPNGGLLGWVAETSIAPAVKDELAIMNIGEVSTPVKTPQGYKIIALHNIQNPKSMEKQDSYELVQVFLPTTMDADTKKTALARIRKTNGSCDDFMAVATDLKTTPRMELGLVAASELPPELLALIRKVGVLKTTSPLKIDSGELIFMACRQTMSSPMPDKNQVRFQVENERLETLAQRYLRDLRRNAIVEKR